MRWSGSSGHARAWPALSSPAPMATGRSTPGFGCLVIHLRPDPSSRHRGRGQLLPTEPALLGMMKSLLSTKPSRAGGTQTRGAGRPPPAPLQFSGHPQPGFSPQTGWGSRVNPPPGRAVSCEGLPSSKPPGALSCRANPSFQQRRGGFTSSSWARAEATGRSGRRESCRCEGHVKGPNRKRGPHAAGPEANPKEPGSTGSGPG